LKTGKLAQDKFCNCSYQKRQQ